MAKGRAKTPKHVEELRDRFAMAALTGLIVSKSTRSAARELETEQAAVYAYQYADAMLAARDKAVR